MGWDNEYQCYTNQDNPFGDSALTNTFVWTKKLAKEGVKSVSRDELEALNRQKQLENKIELEKVTYCLYLTSCAHNFVQNKKIINLCSLGFLNDCFISIKII